MNPGPGNIDRFPHDFAFRFTPGAWALLSSQIATLKTSRSPLSLTHPTADVSAFEREIDDRVYRLYGLTQEEIKIVEDASA